MLLSNNFEKLMFFMVIFQAVLNERTSVVLPSAE